MSSTLRHIITAFIFIFTTCAAYAQVPESVDKRIDMLLERYERYCEDCLNLKKRVNEGEKISKSEAEATVEKFVNTNGILKEISPSLNEAQKNRFEAINNWFNTDKKPRALDHKKFTATETSIESAQAIATQTLMLAEPGNYRHIESKPVKTDIYVLLTHSVAPATYGLGIGLQWKKWGGYVWGTSNFNKTKASYSCNNNGILENGSTFWPSGKTQQKNIMVTAGALYKINDYVNAYAGTGYGRSQALWEDIDNNWAIVGEGIKGICFESGILVSASNIAIGIGISTIAFRTITPSISFGVAF